MPTRVYVPVGLPELRRLSQEGRLGPPPVTAYAVTSDLRRTQPGADEEELEIMMKAVEDVLEEIGAGDRPRQLVLNKADAISDERREELGFRHPDGILVSALTGEGIDALTEAIKQSFEATLADVELLLPYAEGAKLAELHELAGELDRTDRADGVLVRARIPRSVAERYARYAVETA